jgi:hypothetical protein
MKENSSENCLRESCDSVVYNDPLTSIFYDLIRDHLPVSVLEKVVNDAIDNHNECLFANGLIAKYANNLAEDINNAKSIRLKKDLNKVFEEIEYARTTLANVENLINIPKEEMEDEILNKLKEEVEETESHEVEQDVIEHIKESLDILIKKGMFSDEEATKLKSDLIEFEGDCDNKCGSKCCKTTEQDCCQGDNDDGRTPKSENESVEE